MSFNIMALISKRLSIVRTGGSLIVCLYLAGQSIAEDRDSSITNTKFSLGGTVEFDIGEFVKARTAGGGGTNAPREAIGVDHIWFGHSIATLNFNARPSDFFTVKSAFEFRQYATMLPMVPGAMRDPFFGSTYWNGFYIREGQGIFTFKNSESFNLDMAFGYMPYKYNPDVRNLGEFLFRSGTYPLYLINDFDRPYARLMGLRAGTSFSTGFIKGRADVFGLIEHEMKPFNDLSFAAVTSFNFFDCFEIGGGVDLAHLVPVDSRLTTPREEKNSYNYDSIFDQTRNSWTFDTGYYTYQGTKLMLRGSLDFIGLLQGLGIKRSDKSLISELFGPSGGKVYGELGIIGVENYPASQNNRRGYVDIMERIPYMVGANIPLWKILDVCAVEFEYFPSYFPDNYWNPVINAYPLPVTPQGEQYDSTVYKPRWNWSVYMKKQVTNNFGLVLKLGRDHTRWEMHPAQQNYYDFESAMVKPDEWGWQGSAVFSF